VNTYFHAIGIFYLQARKARGCIRGGQQFYKSLLFFGLTAAIAPKPIGKYGFGQIMGPAEVILLLRPAEVLLDKGKHLLCTASLGSRFGHGVLEGKLRQAD